LKQSDGGLDALTEDITSLATNIYEYRSSAGVSPTFTFLDESVLGIRKQKVTART